MMNLGEPYDSMIIRVHEGCIQLLGQARAGCRAGAWAEAVALRGQVAALAELLDPSPMGFLDADGRLAAAPLSPEAAWVRQRHVPPQEQTESGTQSPPVLPVSVQDLTERRGN